MLCNGVYSNRNYNYKQGINRFSVSLSFIITTLFIYIENTHLFVVDFYFEGDKKEMYDKFI